MSAAVEKPPYRVPSMAEIAALPWNGLNAISTFSGCGGSSLGYEMAGFRVLWASEFVPAAQDTYRANHPRTILDERDIRQVRAEDILAATGLRVGQLDLLDGSPPCASFSTAGTREAGWGKVKKYSDVEQRTDDLFFEYARILGGLQPKVFVAENVSGLVKGAAKGYFLEILAAMKAQGYRVKARLLDAQWLGVPQQRQRIIFVGVRNDLGLDPAHPTPLPYRYTVRDALPWVFEHDPNARVVNDTGGQFSQGCVSDRPCPAILVSVNSLDSYHYLVEQRPVEPDAVIDGYAIAPEWDKLRPGEQSEKYFSLVKPSPENPSPTVTATGGNTGAAGVTHPFERRKFTLLELRRICAFPDDFVLTGSYAQGWERLGRAVPPVMMRHVAETIRDQIFAKLPSEAR